MEDHEPGIALLSLLTLDELIEELERRGLVTHSFWIEQRGANYDLSPDFILVDVSSAKKQRKEMAENIKQLRERHEKEIAHLQKMCKHEKSTRMPFMWAPGHFGSDVEVCDYCGKILRRYGMIES